MKNYPARMPCSAGNEPWTTATIFSCRFITTAPIGWSRIWARIGTRWMRIFLSARGSARGRNSFSGVGARLSDGRFREVDTGLVFFPLHRADYLFSAFVEDDINLVNDKLMLTAGTKILRTN
jgi:hypothetical protein